MKKMSSILLIISLLSLAIGLSGVGSNIFSGLSRAAGAVFFVLAFISRVIEKAEDEQPAEGVGRVESPQAGRNEPSGQPMGEARHAH